MLSLSRRMSKSSLQINLEYLIARLLLVTFRLLPVRAAVSLGGWLAPFFAAFVGRLRRVGRRNLSLAFPDLSDGERDRLLDGTFANLGRQFGIFSHFSDSPEQLKKIVRSEGFEHLEAAQALGRGVILFTGHLGGWELSSFAQSLYGYPLSFLVRRIDNPKIEALVDRERQCLGNRTIDKRSAAREMLQILQRKETLGILVDLNMIGREGIFVDFFGVPAATTFVVAKLALRTGAPILPAFAPWDHERQQFALELGPALEFEVSGNEEEDVRGVTQAYTRVVEDYARRYPDQWLWIHRRWKTRPPGEPGIY